MKIISIRSNSKEEFVDITHEVVNAVTESKITNGICCVFTPHTTAAITINENADPDVRNDLIKGLKHLKFEGLNFNHVEGNSPAHLKSSIIGCSENIIIEDRSLCLGTWQGVYFCEFDGPRTRKVFIKII